MPTSILLIFHTVCCKRCPNFSPVLIQIPFSPPRRRILRVVTLVCKLSLVRKCNIRPNCNQSHNFTTLARSSSIRLCTSGNDSNKRCSCTILRTSVGVALIVMGILLTFEYALHTNATTTWLSSSIAFRCSAFTRGKDPTALQIVSTRNATIWLPSPVSRCSTQTI